MSVRELGAKPKILSHFPDAPYAFLELYGNGGVYGYAAIADRGADLELHLSMTRWGARICRDLRRDLEWLREEAHRRGRRRILGIRADANGVYDPGLFRFARLFGATDNWVFQTVAIDVGG